LCAGLVVLALPLCFRLVAPNSFYGFRTPATLADTKLWFDANAFAGYALVVAAVVSALGLSLVRSEKASWMPLIALLLPLTLAFAATLVYISRRT